MDIKTCAEQILNKVGCHDERCAWDKCNCLNYITAKLDEVRTEAYTKGCTDTLHNSPTFKEVFSAAKEKAKVILKDDCEGIVGNENCQCCACLHADRLDQMEE